MPGMEDLYREIILDHYRSPRNRGELPTPPAHAVTGFNPLCGDEVTLYLDVVDGALRDIKITGQGCSISQSSASLMSTAVKGRPLADVRGLVNSFKSMMSIHENTLGGPGGSEDAPGEASSLPLHQQEGSAERSLAPEPGASNHETRGSVRIDDLEELAALQGVVKFPVRIKCATLPWNALVQGLEEIESAAASDTGEEATH
jgi:nitrogen fixation NifU-like protein